ncbi:MAG: polymer-forming cytoskeletal protein [Firmicutes bacterium]|nr:polymer-forming cytoskeletal protein [Bacillota bacterium]
MFGKKKPEEPVVIEKPVVKEETPARFVPSRVTTIGKDVTLVGDFITADTLEIRGTLKGDVVSETKIHIAEGGTLNGDAKATDILVDGQVDGRIVISNIAEISDTGSMQGALEVKTLVTNPGSHFDGRLSIVPERMKPHVDVSEDASAIEY